MSAPPSHFLLRISSALMRGWEAAMTCSMSQCAYEPLKMHRNYLHGMPSLFSSIMDHL